MASVRPLVDEEVAVPQPVVRVPLVAAVVLGLVLALLPVRAARACSCAEPDLAPVMAGAADQALVVAQRVDQDGGPTGELRLLRTLAGGPVDGPVAARFDTGASCDPWVAGGGVAALLLARDGDRWTTTTCGMLAVGDAFAAAGIALEHDPAAGDPTLLLAGNHGGARIAAVDSAGRVVAWATGTGETVGITTCGDDQTVLEVAADDGGLWLHRWSLPDLASSGAPVSLGPQRSHRAGVRCLGPSGERAVVVLPSYGEPGAIAVVDGDTVATRAAPVQDVAVADATLAVLVGTGDVGGSPASTIGTVDDAGEVTRLLSRAGTAFDRLAVSPSGSHVAAAGYPPDGHDTDLVVVAAVDGSGTQGRLVPGYHTLGWLDDDRLWLQDEQTGAFGVTATEVEVRDTSLEVVEHRHVGHAASLVGLPDESVLRYGLGIPSVLRGDEVTQVADVRLAGTSAHVVLDPDAVLTTAEAISPTPTAASDGPVPPTDDGGRLLWVSLGVLVLVVLGSAVALLLGRRA